MSTDSKRAPIGCSIQVLTHNNASTLRGCLESLRAFGEVIVQDGASTDGTREIAKEFPNVTLVDQNPKYLNAQGYITDFSSLRNETIASATYDWIFPVDADEFLSTAEAEEIAEIVSRGVPGVYTSFRRFFLDGQRIDSCSGYPAIQIRLFHRSLIIDGYRKQVHERLQMKSGVIPQMMHAEHPVPLASAEELHAKYQRYLQLEAKRTPIGFVHWCRWILYRNCRTIAILFLRLAWIWLTPRRGKRLPLRYELQAVAYSLSLMIYLFPPIARRRLASEIDGTRSVG